MRSLMGRIAVRGALVLLVVVPLWAVLAHRAQNTHGGRASAEATNSQTAPVASTSPMESTPPPADATPTYSTWPTAAPAEPTPPPMEGPPVRLDHVVVDREGGFTFSPPPDGLEPGISGEDAWRAGWDTIDSGEGATSVQLTFALMTSGKYVDEPVWLLTFQGTCIQINNAPSKCQVLPDHSVLEASDGTWIASFVSPTLQIQRCPLLGGLPQEDRGTRTASGSSGPPSARPCWGQKLRSPL